MSKKTEKRSAFSYTKYLIHEVLNKMEIEARERMERFRYWETDEDLTAYVYYRGRYEALHELVCRLLDKWSE